MCKSLPLSESRDTRYVRVALPSLSYLLWRVSDALEGWNLSELALIHLCCVSLGDSSTSSVGATPHRDPGRVPPAG